MPRYGPRIRPSKRFEATQKVQVARKEMDTAIDHVVYSYLEYIRETYDQLEPDKKIPFLQGIERIAEELSEHNYELSQTPGIHSHLEAYKNSHAATQGEADPAPEGSSINKEQAKKLRENAGLSIKELVKQLAPVGVSPHDLKSMETRIDNYELGRVKSIRKYNQIGMQYLNWLNENGYTPPFTGFFK